MPARRDGLPRRPRRPLSEKQRLALEAERMLIADTVAGVRARKNLKAEVAKGLSDDELRAWLRPTREAMENFRRIQEGKIHRGDMATVSTVKTALDILLAKPKQEMDLGGVEVVVRTLGGPKAVAPAEPAPELPREEPQYTLPAPGTVTETSAVVERTDTGACVPELEEGA